jgi:hypothetical protein
MLSFYNALDQPWPLAVPNGLNYQELGTGLSKTNGVDSLYMNGPTSTSEDITILVEASTNRLTASFSSRTVVFTGAKFTLIPP